MTTDRPTQPTAHVAPRLATSRFSALALAFASAGLSVALVAGVASAQPVAPAPAAPPAAAPVRTTSEKLGPGEEAADKNRPDRLKEALAPRSGGLTPEAVGALAVDHSPQVALAQANRDAASGQVISTVVQYVPKVTLTAAYTRLSDIGQVGFGGGGGALVGARNEGLIRVAPCPDDPAQQCAVDSAGSPLGAAAFSIPQVLNQYTLNANISVPISDYFLRAVQAYQAASEAEDALAFTEQAQRLQAAADAKLALYSWINAKGQAAVTKMSVDQAQAQVDDAKIGLAAGSLARADLMRVEAQLAQAQLTDADAEAIEITAAERLRAVTGMPPEKRLEVGIDIFAPPAVPQVPGADALLAEARKNRLDLEAARSQEEARDDAENVSNAGYLPRVDGIANLTYANPNQRFSFNGEQWNGTWDIGLRATWVLNETFSTIGAARVARAQTAAATAQRRALEDAVRVEVVSAGADLRKAGPQLEAASRGLAAAEESYRVTKQLFAYGKATAVSLTDAEVSLTNARLRKVAAHANLQAAIVRLDHATGRDRVRAAR